MSLQNLELFALVCLVGLILLPIFSLPVMGPRILRAKRLKKLAHKYGLAFRMNFWSNVTFADAADHMERNVIEGILKNKHIKIYDSFDINKSISYPLMPAMLYGRNANRPYVRKTFIEIDGRKETLEGAFLFSFTPVRVVSERLQKM